MEYFAGVATGLVIAVVSYLLAGRRSQRASRSELYQALPSIRDRAEKIGHRVLHGDGRASPTHELQVEIHAFARRAHPLGRRDRVAAQKMTEQIDTIDALSPFRGRTTPFKGEAVEAGKQQAESWALLLREIGDYEWFLNRRLSHP